MVQHCKTFPTPSCVLGFLNKANAPTPEAAGSLPTDLESDERIAKTVIIFHHESTFQANDDELRYMTF